MTGDRPAASDVNAVIDAHERSGYRLAVRGVETFVLDLGHGQPVVCLHGVPASSFLYRKLIAELAARDLRGIAFDLPGLGLAERPAAFDYTWTGLGRFASAAVEALDLDRFPSSIILSRRTPGRGCRFAALRPSLSAYGPRPCRTCRTGQDRPRKPPADARYKRLVVPVSRRSFCPRGRCDRCPPRAFPARSPRRA